MGRGGALVRSGGGGAYSRGMTYDLVVRNGTIVDGSGGPAYRGDVGIAGDAIVTIGRIRERAAREVDAEGHLVAPGFIEAHTHLDAQIFWDPLGTCSSWHGITTAVMGNCGFTVAPCRESEKYLAIRSLERAEDISGAAMEQGIRWQWETFPDFLDALDRIPKGINLAGYVGHSALRSYVMGDASFERESTDGELDAMRRELTAALHAGAIGFSTSRSHNHATSDDRPVASRLASWDEVRTLVGIMGALGVGVFELAQEHHAEADKQDDYLRRLRALAAESGRPVTFVIGSAAGSTAWRKQLDHLDLAAAEGARLIGQTHSREFLSIIGFATNLPFERLAGWAEFRRLPLPEQLARLRTDAELRARLVREAVDGPYKHDAIGSEVRPPVWDAIRVLDRALPPFRTVADVANERGVTPVDVIIDLTLADADQLFAQPFANHDLDDVLTLMRHPRTVIAVSDSGAHVSQIIDSSIPTFLLGYWVRDRQAFTWEEAVRKLTFDPASVWGFSDRGLVRVGSRADLTIFDPSAIGPGVPVPASDLPAGAKRLKQKATGILATVVNGSIFMQNNEHSGAFAGRVLRGPLAR